MWIARDPKENGPSVEARKFSQVFVITRPATRRLLLQFPRDDWAIRQSEDGVIALSIVFLLRLVIHDIPKIVSFHVVMIHRIRARDSDADREVRVIRELPDYIVDVCCKQGAVVYKPPNQKQRRF